MYITDHNGINDSGIRVRYFMHGFFFSNRKSKDYNLSQSSAVYEHEGQKYLLREINADISVDRFRNDSKGQRVIDRQVISKKVAIVNKLNPHELSPDAKVSLSSPTESSGKTYNSSGKLENPTVEISANARDLSTRIETRNNQTEVETKEVNQDEVDTSEDIRDGYISKHTAVRNRQSVSHSFVQNLEKPNTLQYKFDEATQKLFDFFDKNDEAKSNYKDYQIGEIVGFSQHSFAHRNLANMRGGITILTEASSSMVASYDLSLDKGKHGYNFVRPEGSVSSFVGVFFNSINKETSFKTVLFEDQDFNEDLRKEARNFIYSDFSFQTNAGNWKTETSRNFETYGSGYMGDRPSNFDEADLLSQDEQTQIEQELRHKISELKAINAQSKDDADDNDNKEIQVEGRVDLDKRSLIQKAGEKIIIQTAKSSPFDMNPDDFQIRKKLFILRSIASNFEKLNVKRTFHEKV